MIKRAHQCISLDSNGWMEFSLFSLLVKNGVASILPTSEYRIPNPLMCHIGRWATLVDGPSR